MVEGGMTCVKYLLFAFNFLFFIVGLVLIIAGAVIQTEFKQYFDVIEAGEFSGVAILFAVVGVFILVIGFFGCCGAWKENYCMVMTFAGLLTFIFILELAGGIAAFVLQSKVEEIVGKGLNESLDNYDNATATREMWDRMQQDLQCCGVKGYQDWKGKISATQAYPKSCCKKDDEKKPECGNAPGLAYKDGCLKNMKVFIDNNLLWVGVIGLVVAFVEIVGIMFACCLGRAIKKEYEVV